MPKLRRRCLTKKPTYPMDKANIFTAGLAAPAAPVPSPTLKGLTPHAPQRPESIHTD